ncbi:MAG: putative phage abortive infection protein [Fluviicola sp.]|nr:putative phage abortive infection protein [Fluviicola sp.]
MKSYKWYWVAAISCMIAAFLAPLVLSMFFQNEISPSAGIMGDTIGGLTSPFLSIAGSILVFAALKAQIEANKVVQDQFQIQRQENDKRDWEAKLFKLFDLHLSIVDSFVVHTSKIELVNIDANYQFSKIAGFEYNHSITRLLEEYPIMEGGGVFEHTIDLFDWTMFDAARLDEEDKTPDWIIATTLEFFLEGLKGAFYRYYNNCFYIIRMIDSSPFHNEDEKTDLINLYLNHFTYPEIKWLFWISFQEDYVAFTPVLDKYRCFERISIMDLNSKGYMFFWEKYAHLRERFKVESS